jgi:hypothetical protein
MNKHKKVFPVLPVLLIGIFVVLLSTNVYSLINNNGAGRGYDGGGGENAAAKNISIEAYITQGAVHFLDANLDIQALLKLVELQDIQGVDMEQLTLVLDSAAANMKNAAATYEQLIREAEITPYNQSVQAALKSFNYDSFMLENQLNQTLYQQVKGFLKKGDITGVLKQTHSGFTSILEMLNSLKQGISAGTLPDASFFRKLNETCARVSLFGSYAADVFSAILL